MSFWLAAQAVTAWRLAGGGALAAAALAMVTLAQSVGVFYLLGFVAKSATYWVIAGRRAGSPPGSRWRPEGAPGRDLAPSRAAANAPVAVLYLTAGDFDPAAVDSLLRLRADGPKRFVLHDDGDDPRARARMREFLERHPQRVGWDVEVWHRPRREGGKAGAVNWVVERLDPRWPFLLLCDSDSIALHVDALRLALHEFDDPRVAVLQFRNAGFSGPDEPALQQRLARAIDVFDVFAAAQARWGYVPFFGHNAVLRIEELRRLGGLTPGFFSDDLDFSARLTLAGRRIAYRPDLAFGERHPGDWLAFRKRARKWALGCMQVLRSRLPAVLTAPGIPFAHRVGLVEFMAFYPAQALLLAGLLATHLVLPWIVPGSATGAYVAAGIAVVAALFAPTLAWCARERRMLSWPALAWGCALVYGGSLLSTARGVLDGVSRRERPWVPTNLDQPRPAVPAQGWLEAGLGLALLGAPWLAGSAALAFPASYVFLAVFLLSPLTFAAYRRPRVPAPVFLPEAGSRARAAVATVLCMAAIGVASAAAGPDATVSRDRLLVDGAPYQVRGVHYSPWLPGSGPDGRSAYPGPETVERDLASIQGLGANTLLLHSAPGWVIERAAARGFRSLYAFSFSWSDTSASAFQRQAESVLAAVDSLRRHRAVIAWILGNEIPVWVVEQLGQAAVEDRLRGLAYRVRALDPGRLLGHANWPPTRHLDLGFFDIVCFNLYPAWPYEVSVKGFGPYLREVLVPLARGRPLLVSEFGINSLEAGEARQAEVLGDCWREIERSPVVGGVLFEWSDEWWKNFDNPQPGRGYWERAYAPDDALRHDVDPEEHYGVVRTDRTPKPAYEAMRALWGRGLPRRSWMPWAVVVALAGLSWLVLGVGRRRGAAREAKRAASAAWVIAAALLGHGGPAHGSTWTQRDTLTGANPDDQLGWALAGVGDVDGDGRGEVAVAARFFMVGPDTAAGAVYVHPIGQGSFPVSALRLEGISNHEHFGESVAGGQDVDGDGQPDIAVGAPLRAVSGKPAAGAVDLFRGGALEAGRWTTLGGEARDDWFGQSVAVGDLDGDGRAEVIVGAPYNDRVASAAGAVFVFRGGPAPLSLWRIFTGQNANDQFGWAVAYVGDMDADGFGDFVVGARLFGSGLQSARGKAYFYRGGPVMDTVADGTWLGEARDDWFGNSVAGPGDVDGGGRPDLLVGAPYNDRGGSAAGAAFLYRGEDPPGSAFAAVYVGESSDAHLGWSIGGSGDANGDGRPDVVAGARLQASGSKVAAGRIYLFPGGSVLSSVPLATADGEAAHDWLGHAVGGAPGLFTAGLGTAAAGAPYNDAGGSAAGRGYVLGLGSTVSVASREGGEPAGLQGLQVFPNPARARTALRWIGEDLPVYFEVLDLQGRLVRVLEAKAGAGQAQATWDGRDEDGVAMLPGLYWVRARTAGRTAVGPAMRLILLR